MIPIKSNLGRANAARIIFYLLLTISIASFYSLFLQYQLLTNAKNGIGITQEAASFNDMRQQVLAIIDVILLLISVIAFLMWVYRAYENLTNLKITTLNFTPGWAVGNWFIPIISWFRPYTAMREIWEETQNYTLTKEQKQNSVKPTIVGIWWGLYLIEIFLSKIVVGAFKGDSGIDGLLTLTTALMVSTIFAIAVKIVTLIMINKIVIFEKDLWDFVNNQVNLQSKSMDIPAI